ncbi:MAG TPA: hypothetical protein DDY68_00830 [Porphyromonadaceae bacterium]|nr:hypothetical protein [Porphyromonadaceae bacterium]
MPKNDTMIHIGFNSKRAQFAFNKYQLDCTLTEGTYPKYQAVIPKKSKSFLRIDKNSFLSALRRVAICSNEVNNLVKFELSSTQQKLIAQDTLNSTSAEENIL